MRHRNSPRSLPRALAMRRRFSAMGASKSMLPAASGPTAILSMWTRGPGAYIVPRPSAMAITEMAPGRPDAVRVVPSIGSTATSTTMPTPVPTFSPLKSIGASSFSPSPITTTPSMSRVERWRRMPSTAAWSTASLSPRPSQRAAPRAAVSVTRTRSSPKLRLMGSAMSGDLDDDGISLTATTTEGGGADSATACHQCVDQSDHETGAGRPERVTQCHGATVDVDPVDRQVEESGRPQRNGGEGLVDLDDVEVGGGETGLLQGDGQGLGGTLVKRGVDTAHLSVGEDPGENRRPHGLGRLLRGDYHGGCSVRDLRGVGGGDGAPCRERGAKLGDGLDAGAGADPLVTVDGAIGAFDRHDLLAEVPRARGLLGTLMAHDRPLVLFLAGDPETLVLQVRRLAHRALVEGAEETVVLHHVDDVRISDADSPAKVTDHMGGVGHAFHAARHHELGLAEADGPVCQGDGRHPREAHLVDGGAGNGHGEAAGDGGLARGDLAFPGLEDVAEQDLVDGGGVDAGPLHGAGDGGAAEIHGALGAQHAVVLADRRPGDAGDDCHRKSGYPGTARRPRGGPPYPRLRRRYLPPAFRPGD